MKTNKREYQVLTICNGEISAYTNYLTESEADAACLRYRAEGLYCWVEKQ